MGKKLHFSSYSGTYFRKSQSFFKAAFKKIELTLLDAIIIIKVCEYPGIIQEQIAYELVMDNAAVARSLKELESRKIISRIIDKNNQRTKKVYEGKNASYYRQKIEAIMNHWSDLIFKDFTIVEQDLIISSMTKLREKAIGINIDKELQSLNLQGKFNE